MSAPRGGWSAAHEQAARAAGWPSWEAWIQKVAEERGFPVCGRRNRRGEPCALPQAHGVPDKRVGACSRHGGASPAGVASPGWKHGRDSRAPSVVGSDIRARVQRYMALPPAQALALAQGVSMAMMEAELALEEGQGYAAALAPLREVVRSASAAARVASEQAPALPVILHLFDRFAGDVVSLLDGLPLTPEQKRSARVELAGIVSTYLRAGLSAPPAVKEAPGDDG